MPDGPWEGPKHNALLMKDVESCYVRRQYLVTLNPSKRTQLQLKVCCGSEVIITAFMTVEGSEIVAAWFGINVLQ
jgi:hypothetical protein